MRILVGANERHYQKMKNPLISHCMTKLSTGCKFQLMTSFCLQISCMIYGDIVVFEL